MGKLIGGINMTLDGFCDHTAISPDDEIHQHYADLLKSAGTVLYGRITFELMKYWQEVAENPTGNKATDEFAVVMNDIPKLVFSRTLNDVEWATAKLASRSVEQEARELKQQSERDILVGSRSLIIQLINLHLLDELQLCVHPVVAGSGLPLFEDIANRATFNLVKTKTFAGGAVTLYYQPARFQ